MNNKYTLPAAVIGISIALVQPQAARAISSNNQVDVIGERITVLINSKEPGSGVIVKGKGNILTDALLNGGNARDKLGNKQAQISDYEQVIKINPNDAEAYYNRGVVRAKNGTKYLKSI
jgi:tetratricopeptide (TPR) repeat protein